MENKILRKNVSITRVYIGDPEIKTTIRVLTDLRILPSYFSYKGEQFHDNYQ